jgi:hypothetical protein
MDRVSWNALFVGSGNGIEVLALRSLGYNTWGIDMRPPLSEASLTLPPKSSQR